MGGHLKTLFLLAASIYAASKTEFANNSLKSPKIGKLNIDTLIIPQGLLIHEQKPDQKISCYCPFKQQLFWGHGEYFTDMWSRILEQVIAKFLLVGCDLHNFPSVCKYDSKLMNCIILLNLKYYCSSYGELIHIMGNHFFEHSWKKCSYFWFVRLVFGGFSMIWEKMQNLDDNH